MGSFFIAEGLVIARLGQTLEYAARAGDELYFEEPETGKRITLTESAFWAELHTQRLQVVDAFSSPKVLTVPEPADQRPWQDLTALAPSLQDDVVRKVTYITRLREAGVTRGQTLLIAVEAKRIAQDIADARGVPGTTTIQRWWKEYDTAGGESQVLISGNARRQRGRQVDDASEAFVDQQIDDKYAVDARPTKVGAYRDYEDALTRENAQRAQRGESPLRLIAERTFYARIAARPQKELMEARHGYQAARRHYHMIKGHLPAEHALDVVEIDHTPLNLYVIDDLAFLPLGRPWLTALRDRYSGVVLGFYLSFQATGLDSIFGAFKHSLQSHHLAYQLWPELENPWPAFGRAHYYLSDRGADFLSPRYRSAVVSLGALYEYCERRTPWLKGGIERFFLTLEQTFFEAMPGRTFSNLATRGDYDPAKDAVVRFSTLVFLLHKWAADCHNVLPNKRKQARPIDLWNESVGIAPPPYRVPIDHLNIVLGDHCTGTLSHEGIRHRWLTYADDQLSALMETLGKGIEVNYVVSREDLGSIYVQDPRTRQYLSIPSTRPDYASGLSVFQHAYLRKEAGVHLKKECAVDTLVKTRATIQSTLRDELDAKKNATKVRLARVAGINSNAVLEGSPKSVTTPLPQMAANADQLTVKAAGPSFANVPRYSWGT